MKKLPRRALAAALVLASTSSAYAQGGCTHETLSVRGTPVSAAYCIISVGRAVQGHELPVQVSQTYRAPRGSESLRKTLLFIAGEPSSRVIEDVPLRSLGLTGTLHVTLLFEGGLVRIDSAMLTPGAITIK